MDANEIDINSIADKIIDSDNHSNSNIHSNINISMKEFIKKDTILVINFEEVK